MRYRSAICLLATFFALSCSGSRPERADVDSAELPPCPDSPNCVSSDETRESHRVPPLELTVPASEGWPAAIEVVSQLPRTEILSQTNTYLHAECSSAIMRFVDDLELRLHPGRNQIAIRSASRIGYGDLGVNRDRVETIRAALVERGVCRAAASD